MTAQKIAQEKARSLGFGAIEHIGTWKGLQVFDYYNREDQEGGDIGLPSYILTDGVQIRLAEGSEALDIINALFPE